MENGVNIDDTLGNNPVTSLAGQTQYTRLQSNAHIKTNVSELWKTILTDSLVQIQ